MNFIANPLEVPLSSCASVLLEALCPEASATALVALADLARTTAWQLPNRYYQFTSIMPERWGF